MFLDLVTYLHPLVWLGFGILLGAFQGLFGSLSANMASRRGLEWQTAFLLSYLFLAPIIWLIYSSRPVAVDKGFLKVRWLSIVGSSLLSLGLVVTLVTSLMIEGSLAGPPISVLGVDLSSYFGVSAFAGLSTFLGASLLVGRALATWTNESSSTFKDDWRSIFHS